METASGSACGCAVSTVVPILIVRSLAASGTSRTTSTWSKAIVEASAHHLHVVGKAKAPLEAAGHMAGVRGFRCPALARCSAGPWVRVRLNAVLTRATCENACGKFPTWRPRRGSNSSANRPTSNMLQPTSGIETGIYRLFLLRVELYINCHWRANVERSQVPRKIFERGALWQYKR